MISKRLQINNDFDLPLLGLGGTHLYLSFCDPETSAPKPSKRTPTASFPPIPCYGFVLFTLIAKCRFQRLVEICIVFFSDMFTHPRLMELLEGYIQKYGDIYTIHMGQYCHLA